MLISSSILEPELTDYYRIWWDGILLSKAAQKRMKIWVSGACEEQGVINFYGFDENGVALMSLASIMRGLVVIEPILKQPKKN